MIIPKKENIARTSEEDPLNRYYTPILRHFYLKRLKLVLDQLGNAYCDNLLEIGYGSGIFLPELAKRCHHLYGVDIHDRINIVEEMLEKEKTDAILSKGDILHLDYEPEIFDIIVCVSVLEHIEDLTTAINEVHRVLKKKGVFVLGFPTNSKALNLYFKMINLNPNWHAHSTSHTKIMERIKKSFRIERILRFPQILPESFSLYYICKCIKE